MVKYFIKTVLQQCHFSIENHVFFTFGSLSRVNQEFSNLVNPCIKELARAYCTNVELLRKTRKGKYVVMAMDSIWKLGSFGGVLLELTHILNFSRWNSAWLE